MNSRTITVRAVVPHYFAEASSPVREIGAGFGSRQPGGRLARSIAFSRCLHGLLHLRRSIKDLQLDFRTAEGIATPASTESCELKLEVVVVVCQGACLLDVIAPLVPQVQLLRRDLDDPRELGLVARDWLISHPSPADLNLYLEDDLVIQDPLFVDKILLPAFQPPMCATTAPVRVNASFGSPPLDRWSIDHGEIEAGMPTAGIATGEFRGNRGSSLIVQQPPFWLFWYFKVTAVVTA